MRPIQRRQFLESLSLGALGIFFTGAGLLSSCVSHKSSRPNIIFILIDDLGWKDVGYHDSRLYETPNIDKLAGEGMRFAAAYAACPVCSPTRSSILTGKYPARLDQTDWIPGRGNSPENKFLQVDDLNHLPLEEVTIAERLKEAGYVTCHIGKWHMGGEGHLPGDQGFDINIAGNERGSPPSYYYPYKRGDYQLKGLAATGEEGEYLIDRISGEAVQFITDHQEQPFFLYLSHYAVHTPRQAKESLREYYEQKLDNMPEPEGPLYQDERYNAATQLVQNNPEYAGMVQSMDESVGRVMRTLEEVGMSEHTIIFFMSDNGGLSTLPPDRTASTANTPLRAGKGWLYEGGIREPMIVKWPGVTSPGSVCTVPVISTDFYPTILEMARLEPEPQQHQDGESLVPLLRGGKSLGRDALYWHYPHYHGSNARPHGAIRMGDYKLIEFYEDMSVELYNLGRDVEERNNLAASLPEKTDALRKRLHAWRKSVDAQMPEPNPDYEPPGKPNR